jgi:predicted nucleotide-binding protein (sugar kinase/HSP70/actin superfamily)
MTKIVKVGIPRALAYYQYYPMWETFFKKLGADVISTPPTTQQTLAKGSQRVVADTCLPAKVFLGHVIELAGNCDYVFIPIIRSVKKKVYNCPKFLGLSDMTRAVIPECPTILDIDFDINKGRDRVFTDIYLLGRHFTHDQNRIKQAASAAWQAHLEYRESMSRRGITPLQILQEKQFAQPISNNAESSTSIAIVGHPYLLYDELVNHRLIQRLEKSGCRVVTPEMLTAEQLESATNRLVGRAYWTWEEEVVGAGNHYIENRLDGIIGVAAFGCGPDSLMMDMVRRQASEMNDTPFMNLTLEEHTAETGVITRLEAFIDMIQRRKRRLLTCV